MRFLQTDVMDGLQGSVQKAEEFISEVAMSNNRRIDWMFADPADETYTGKNRGRKRRTLSPSAIWQEYLEQEVALNSKRRRTAYEDYLDAEDQRRRRKNHKRARRTAESFE